jgi:hypothetical protein
MKTNLLFIVAGSILAAGQLHAGGLVAHEWGTFTSLQGSDGVLIQWNPLASSKLPGFVHNRTRPVDSPVGGVAVQDVKAVNLFTQRLETPVIYFYNAETATVNVKVNFPKGVITEWYPQVTAFGPYFQNAPTRPNPEYPPLIATSKESFAQWDDTQLLGAAASAEKATTLRNDGTGNHYYAARETGSLLVQSRTPLAPGNPETEKFIFYRGAGNFETPLAVSLESDSGVLVRNRGVLPLRQLFVLNVKNKMAKYTRVDGLDGNENKQVDFEIGRGLEPLDKVVASLGAEMEASLATEGLYADEAKAMVKTWRDSWFAEDGLRVLYTLPREWTDGILLLKIAPAPSELVRVMVGRAEIFSPGVEQRLRGIYTELLGPGGVTDAANALADLHLGRFAPGALTRIATLESDHVDAKLNLLRVALSARETKEFSKN